MRIRDAVEIKTNAPCWWTWWRLKEMTQVIWQRKY
jgi:hypothetical protein